MLGFVYIMSNEAMPGIYKIGCTSRKPEERASDLYTTGVPTPFIVEYCIYIENYESVEKLVHKSLAQYNFNKEFFRYDLIKCILELKRIAIEQSSYKEKYRTKHLRAMVEGWEKDFIKEQEEIARDKQEEDKGRDSVKKEIDNASKKGKISIWVYILMAIIIYAISKIYYKNKYEWKPENEFISSLSYEIKKENSKTPRMIDEVTRLDKVESVSKNIYYYYTLIIPLTHSDEMAIQGNFPAEVNNHICKNKDLRTMLSHGVTIYNIYYNTDHKRVCEVKTTKSDCIRYY